MISALLSIWWLWIAIALIFALIELVAPSFIFLGFALGALATSVLVGLGYVPSAPALFACFAVVSLAAWIGLRLAFRRQSSDAKIITKDINDH
jgi:membrane protein implicated in regulation of membrane protease activity